MKPLKLGAPARQGLIAVGVMLCAASVVSWCVLYVHWPIWSFDIAAAADTEAQAPPAEPPPAEPPKLPPFDFAQLPGAILTSDMLNFRVNRVVLARALVALQGDVGARMEPVRAGDDPGYRLFEVDANGLLARLGLQSEDVVLSINDQPVPADAAALAPYYKGLIGQLRYTVVLLRKGEEVTQTYDAF